MTTTLEADRLPSESRTNRPWPKVWPEFLGKWPRLTGRQQPLVETWHEGDEAEGERCVRFGIRIGLRCMPWEWMIVLAIMSLLAPNEWGLRLYTHRNVVIECTRQQGKTLILILIILWKLFKRRRRVVYTAQQWTTVEDVFDRVVAVIDRVPSLKRRLASPPSKKDNRGAIVLKPIKGDKHVVKANFGPRTQHFARGFTEIDDLILDEAYDLVPKDTANLTGAQAASDNPQTIYASTCPVIDDHPNCHRLAGFHRQGLAGGSPSLYYALYAAPGHMKRTDFEAYPLAQPSYGVVGNDREMEAYLQGAKTSADRALFDADWLGHGKYPPPETESHAVFNEDAWRNMRDSTPKFVGSRVIALGRSPDRGTWVIAAAQRTAAGRTHLEIGFSRSVSMVEFVNAVVAVVVAWDPLAVVINHQSSAMEAVPALVKAGIEATVANATNVQAACGGFLSAVMDKEDQTPLEQSVSHSGQALLNTAVGSAEKKELPGGRFVWDLDADASSAQLDAATLAHWGLIVTDDRPPPPPPPLSDTSDRQHEQNDQSFALDDEFDALSAAF